jgi:hypothetical protein
MLLQCSVDVNGPSRKARQMGTIRIDFEGQQDEPPLFTGALARGPLMLCGALLKDFTRAASPAAAVSAPGQN